MWWSGGFCLHNVIHSNFSLVIVSGDSPPNPDLPFDFHTPGANPEVVKIGIYKYCKMV